jgi:hypothetical protein
VLIAGVARSGTTWLAELLCSQISARMMFEPFNNLRVSSYRRFEYVQYMRPDDEHPELLEFVASILGGAIRDPHWVDRMVDCRRPEHRVVKAVRACLMLRWIHDRFPLTPSLFIVRHPCAVVASFQKLEWSAAPDLESFTRQTELRADHLDHWADTLRAAVLPHQKAALMWCVNHRVVLSQAHGSGIVPLHYENLVSKPDESIPRIFTEIHHAFDESLYDELRRPSRTAKGDLRRAHSLEQAPTWTKLLSPAQIDDVLEIVSTFGLSHLYDGLGRPTGKLLDHF